MAKATLVFPAAKVKTTQDRDDEIAEAVRRGYPTVNGKQAIGKNVISTPDGKTTTEYRLTDDTVVKLDESNNVIAG